MTVATKTLEQLDFTIHSVPFSLRLPERLVPIFLEGLPGDWLRTSSKNEDLPVYSVVPDGPRYSLYAGANSVYSCQDELEILAQAEDALACRVAFKDRRRDYTRGASVVWFGKLWALVGSRRMGCSTLLHQMVKDGGKVLSDRVIVTNAKLQVRPFAGRLGIPPLDDSGGYQLLLHDGHKRSLPQSPDYFLLHRYSPESGLSLVSATPGEVVAEMINNSHLHGRDSRLSSYVKMATQGKCLKLVRGNAGDAVDALRDHVLKENQLQ